MNPSGEKIFISNSSGTNDIVKKDPSELTHEKILEKKSDEFSKDNPSVQPKWSPLATFGLKALAGLGCVVCSLLAIALLPITIVGLFMVARGEELNPYSLGAVLSSPFWGALCCVEKML